MNEITLTENEAVILQVALRLACDNWPNFQKEVKTATGERFDEDDCEQLEKKLRQE